MNPIETIHYTIEWTAICIELLGVLVITGSVVIMALTRGTVRFLFQLDKEGAYESYKHRLGRGLLLGMDLLVAGDIIRSVALEDSLANVALLGLLVIIRTFLAWSLGVEIKGHWPWQGKRDSGHAPQHES